ncbi:MAG: nucleotidyltransferase family protein [Actinomycetota bacterium]|nr:nucleotidyltransferase family protein [Actinomycetota bacterium]
MSATTPDASFRAIARNLAVDAMTAHCGTELLARGVSFIVLKGPSTRRWLYADRTPRTYVDSDLLVAPDDYETAEDVLRGLGYRPFRFTRKHDLPIHAWTWITDGHSVDLHRFLLGVGASPQQMWSILQAETEPIDVAGVSMQALAEPGRALHVALHAVQHPRADKPLQDLRRAIDLVPHEVWLRSSELAERLDAAPAFRTGLELLPEGRVLSRQLGLQVDPRAEDALRAAGDPPGAQRANWLLEQRNARAIAGFVAGRLFPPATYIRVRYQIARRGRLGLIAAYVMRPFHVLVIAPTAFMRARRARRDAR